MKILIATGIFPPQVGGPATYSKLLLDKLPERGFDVTVINFGDLLRYPKILRHIMYFFRVLLKAQSVDIVYAQDPVSVGLPALFVAKILGKKFYLKIVGDYAWEQGTQRFGVTDLLDEFSREYSKYRLSVRFLKRVEFFVANHTDQIIVPSNYLKKIVTNWGVSSNKIQVIYNAFHAPNFRVSKEAMRKKFDIDYPMIISAGRLVPWKGFDTLIALMPDITQKIPRSKLFIVGDGPDKEYLNTCVKMAKAEHCVVLTGKLDQTDLFEYIQAADLFVLNTSYEGLSHQLLEVLFLGVPIVTTFAGGNSEVIDDNQNGVLVTYNDKKAIHDSIVRLLTDRTLAEHFVQKGKEKLGFFGEERMLAEIAETLSKNG